MLQYLTLLSLHTMIKDAFNKVIVNCSTIVLLYTVMCEFTLHLCDSIVLRCNTMQYCVVHLKYSVYTVVKGSTVDSM